MLEQQINYQEPGVIITTDANKYNLISKINAASGFSQLHTFTLAEVETMIYGELSSEAIMYATDFFVFHKGIKLTVAVIKKYLNELKRINVTIDYQETELKLLKKLKAELLANNLLKISEYQKSLFKQKNIYLFDVKLEERLQKELEKLNPVIIKEIKLKKDFKPTLYCFNNYLNEINFVANEIATLVARGIDINKICLHIPTNDYYPQIRLIFNNYNLPLCPQNSRRLNSYQLIRQLLELISTTNDLNCLETIELKPGLEQDLYNQLIAIINKYPNYHQQIAKLLPVLENEVKNVQVKTPNMVNVVRQIDLQAYYPQADEYVFVVNAAEQKFPSLIKDTYLMSDIQAVKYEQTPTYILNKNRKDLLREKLTACPNLVLTFASTSPVGTESLASVLKTIALNCLEPVERKMRYSQTMDQINLAKAYELKRKFGTNGKEINQFKQLTLPPKFDNQINTKLPRVNNETLSLSPTSIEKFYKCEFKFYVEQILRIRPQVGDMRLLNIGNLFHYVLEQTLKQNKTSKVDIYQFIVDYNNHYQLEIENLFIDKYCEYLTEIVQQIVDFQDKSTYAPTSESFEKEVKMILDAEHNIELVGKIDKFLELDIDDKYCVVIIDYKTKNTPKIDHKLFDYGLDLQNFIYFYLLKHDRADDEFELVGTFQQRIKPQHKVNHPDFINDFQLFGYATSNEEKLRQFEPDFAEKKLSILKNVEVTKSGFAKRSKVADEEMIEQFNKIVDQKIKQVVTTINNNDYHINPKLINNKDVSCLNCHLRPICLKMKDNYVNLTEEDDA